MSDHTRRMFGLVAWFAASAGAQKPEEKIVFRFQVKEKADVFSWFPLQVGNGWVYKDSLKSQAQKYLGSGYMQESGLWSDFGFPIDDHYPTCRATWLREILVKEHRRVPQGLVVITQERITGVRYSFPEQMAATEKESWLRDASLLWLGGSPDRITVHQVRRLIRGNAVYRLAPEEWNDAQNSLAKGFEHVDDRAEPEFFFPLKSGLRWADSESEQEEYRRLLERETGSPPPGTFRFWVVYKEVPEGLFSLSHGFTKGGSEIWFKKGVGTTRDLSRTYVSGYIWHYTSELDVFNPAIHQQ